MNRNRRASGCDTKRGSEQRLEGGGPTAMKGRNALRFSALRSLPRCAKPIFPIVNSSGLKERSSRIKRQELELNPKLQCEPPAASRNYFYSSPPTGKRRIRMRAFSSTTTHPLCSGSSAAGRLARSTQACCSGRLFRTCRMRIKDGALSALGATNVAKSVSAETIM